MFKNLKFFSIISLLLLSSCLHKNISKESNKLINKIDTGVANVYLLKSKKNNILVDTSSPNQEKFIIKKMAELGVLPQEIDLIILTHAHGDHAGSTKYFQENFKIPIMIGKGDEGMANTGKNNPVKTMGLLAKIIKPFVDYNYEPFEPNIIIDKDYSLEKYGIKGTVSKVGGHTSGSLIIKIGNDVLVGDLIRGGIINQNEPKEHFFHDQPEKSKATIRKLVRERFETFYPAHWGPLKRKDILKKYLN